MTQLSTTNVVLVPNERTGIGPEKSVTTIPMISDTAVTMTRQRYAKLA